MSLFSHDAAQVSLASSGIEVENGSSNAGYYVAGASLVAAATVTVVLMKKNVKKEVEQPLLTVDDDFKAQQ